MSVAIRKILICVSWFALVGFDYANCSPGHLTECENTNQLIWSDEFIADLNQFAGSGTENWLYQNGDRIEQIISVLGGPPKKPVEFAPNLLRFSACRAQSCWEKGSAILMKDGTIRAIAILHFNCENQCSDNYTLTIIIDKNDELIIQELKKWSLNIISEYNSFYINRYGEEFRTKLDGVDIRYAKYLR